MIVINYRTSHFVSTKLIFSYVQISPLKYVFFIVKSPSVNKRFVSQENAFRKSKNPSAFFHKTLSSNNSCIPIKNNFRFLR